MKSEITITEYVDTIIELRSALEHAREIIHIWHGEPAWEIYLNHAPEMKVINDAIDQGHKIFK